MELVPNSFDIIENDRRLYNLFDGDQCQHHGRRPSTRDAESGGCDLEDEQQGNASRVARRVLIAGFTHF